jgi:predicted dehydrogenase
LKKHGILLVGAKRTHQRSHAEVFGAHPRCNLVAVASEKGDPEGRATLYQALADDLGVPYIPDLDEALARDDVDIVSSTPMVELRGGVAAKCMDAGKHVYMDKPLAGTVEDLDLIVAASERNDVRVQMFTMNLAPWVQAARQAVADGRVGELLAVHAENIFAKGRAGSVNRGTVRQEKETSDRFTFIEAKREMFDVGIYSLGFIHAITGRAFESVYAHTGNYFFAEHASVGVEDFGAMAIKLEGGVTATLAGGRFGWTSHPKGGPQKVVIVGTEGTLTFDAYRPRIELYNNEVGFSQPAVDPHDPMGMWEPSHPAYGAPPKQTWTQLPLPNAMALDVDAFVRCIEEGREPDVNPRVAASMTEVILGAYASAARGEEVALPLPRS